jgi:hypothetical protein
MKAVEWAGSVIGIGTVGVGGGSGRGTGEGKTAHFWMLWASRVVETVVSRHVNNDMAVAQHVLGC